MDEHALRVLEYDRIREQLDTFVSSGLGRELVQAMEPLTDVDSVSRMLVETSEARRILSLGEFPLRGLKDVRPSIKRARIGGTLTPQELLDVGDVLGCARLARKFFVNHEEGYPHLYEYGAALTAMPGVEDAISGAISQDAQVSDNASPKLRHLRVDIRTQMARVRERIDSFLRSSAGQKYLQENIVTMRSDRYVVPVKQEYRNQVQGIIHDQSASGATLFIELMAVVEANNELTCLRLEESQEVERILAELSALIQAQAENIDRNMRVLGSLDFVLARAAYSDKLRAVEPEVNPFGITTLRQARHPLIAPDKVVPINVTLGEEFSVLLITGPNTGGKTATLKTIGLLTLMAQSGLHIPAGSGSSIGVYSEVLADIGDEQSLTQSLSTFSAHMRNVIAIVGESDKNTLALLDELGAGTDPAEGAALAMAVIDTLRARGTRVAATTHYSELKSYAYTQPGVQNASMTFDLETLSPTYHLEVGLPGKSMALAIASRLGMDDSVIASARSHISLEQARVEDLIKGLQDERAALEQEKTAAREERMRAEKQRQEYQSERERIEREKSRILDATRKEASALLKTIRTEMDAQIASLKSAFDQTADQRSAGRAIEQARSAWRALDDLVPQAAPEPKRVIAPEPVDDDRPLSSGDTVYVPVLNQEGTLLTEPGSGEQVQVQVGSMRLSVPVSGLRRVHPKPKAEPQTQGFTIVTANRSVSMELDLRGYTIDDAIPTIDKYLDDAVMGGLSTVHIIHGKGTGALRNGVREYLRSHSHVAEFRLGGAGEGGSGVTVVKLK
jgi:DNA mismatch repair protein MutS2